MFVVDDGLFVCSWTASADDYVTACVGACLETGIAADTAGEVVMAVEVADAT